MKILVCISHVPDTTSKINFTEGDTKFDTNGVQFVINPYDEFSLTRAMWFKEKQGASVTVVNVGNATTEPTLRKALAIGADDAIRVKMEATDGLSVAKQLAEVVKNGGYDLVIAGRESIDYNGGMVPGMLAELTDANFVNNCISIEVDGTNATAMREIDGGKETATQRVSNTKPISQNNKELIKNTSKAGELLGKKLIYLEAGSGAKMPVDASIISIVKNNLNIPLIVGGGIRSKKQLENAFAAGADIVVIGTAFENDETFFNQLKKQ